MRPACQPSSTEGRQAMARAKKFQRLSNVAAIQVHHLVPSRDKVLNKLLLCGQAPVNFRLIGQSRRRALPRLTPHGETFLRRAIKILEEVDAAKREASDAHGLLRGRLTVGVLPTIAPYLLPEGLVAFAEKFPAVEIVVQEGTTCPSTVRCQRPGPSGRSWRSGRSNVRPIRRRMSS
jgi:LysR substrate binding domain